MGMPEMDHHKNNPQISTKEQSNTVEQRQSFQKNRVKYTGHSHTGKKKPRERPNILHRINSKGIIDLKLKYKAIKLLEYSIGENLDDFGYGYDFLDTSHKLGENVCEKYI